MFSDTSVSQWSIVKRGMEDFAKRDVSVPWGPSCLGTSGDTAQTAA